MNHSHLPKRRTRPRMMVKESAVIRCPQHLKWIRGLECATCASPIVKRFGAVCHYAGHKIEAAHVRTKTDGGIGMKPGDNWAIPLCHDHHRQQHDIGEPAFESIYSLDMKKIAAELWLSSPHGVRYRLAHDTQGES